MSSDRSDILTEREKEIRDQFTDYYLEDQNGYRACLRIGYSPGFAKQYAEQFLEEEYTLNLIALKKGRIGAGQSVEVHKQNIIAMLYSEARDRSSGSSQSGRVAAIGRLCAIFGLDAPTRSQQEVTVKEEVEIDYSKLNDDELTQLESLVAKATKQKEAQAVNG